MSEQHSDTSRLVVVVDDDPDWQEIEASRLEGEGYRVERFFTAEEALAFMRDRTPRLIVSDLMMERLDSGFDFAGRVRSDPRLARVPILIMTAAAAKRGFDLSPQNSDDLAAMGVDAFLDKSENEDRFLEAVRRLIATSGKEARP